MQRTLVLAMLLVSVLGAQDIAGDWQGTLKIGKTEIRVVISLAKAPGGDWTATERPRMKAPTASWPAPSFLRGHVEREQEVAGGNADAGFLATAQPPYA
jgi:hypothetical protein